MPELKVECDCGQRYKFDVEPVNGRMPFTVSCPACGVDGTSKANDLLQQSAGVAPAANPIHLIELPPIGAASTAPAPMASPVSAPAPSSPITPGVSSPTAPPAGPPKLRINIPAHTPADSAPPPLSPMAPPPTIAPLSASGRAGAAAVVAVDPDKPARKPNFWMGITGALLGSLVGAVLCFIIFKFTGVRFRIIGEVGSIAIGYLAGAGAAFLGKGEGSKELGGIAAIFALAGIIAAQYFTAISWYKTEASDFTGSAYTQDVKEAKEVIKQVPTGSDAEIRSYLVKQAVEDGDDAATNSVTVADINDFRTNEDQLPKYQALASGQMTEQQYDQKNGIDPAQEKKTESRVQLVLEGILFLYFLNKLNIVMMIAAVGLAYRITANA